MKLFSCYVYRALWNGIVGGGRFVLIICTALRNGIVGGGRFVLIICTALWNVLWVEGDLC